MFIVLNSLLNKLLIEAHLSFHFRHQLLIDIEFLSVVAKIKIFRLVHLIEWMSP